MLDNFYFWESHMSFFKSLILAIVATLFITYALGVGLLEVFDMGITIGDEVVEPLQAIGVSALVAVLLVLAALAIVFTVFGSLIFVGMMVFGGIALCAIGVFWPILLVAVIIWLICRDKPQATYS